MNSSGLRMTCRFLSAQKLSLSLIADNAYDRFEILYTRRLGKVENHAPVRKSTRSLRQC